jgi:transcriptional regulator with XRE-family HTH domain
MLHYDRRKVGKHLKSSREKANLTQAEASKAFGYTSSQFISNIERGVSVAPLALLAKMVRLYKANPRILERIILESQEHLLLEAKG